MKFKSVTINDLMEKKKSCEIMTVLEGDSTNETF
jgi:hypothetical protein